MFSTYLKNTDSKFGAGSTIEESEKNAIANYIEKYPEEESGIDNIEWYTQEDFEIIYYAFDMNMGDDMTESDCQDFRNFAEIELKNKYPNHEITVSKENNLSNCYTDDYENEEEIQQFCKGLWNRYN